MSFKFTWRIWMFLIIIFFSLIAIFGLPPVAFQNGILVKGVEKNSSAFEAGFREGQIITHLDGNKINDGDSLHNYLSSI